METVQEVVIAVLMITGGVLGMVAAFAVGAIALAVADKTRAWANRIDTNPAVLALGRSPIGQAAHTYLTDLLPKVDESTDPLVQTVGSLRAIQYLKKAGLISDDFAASVLKSAVETGIKLTDGIPDVEVTVKK